MLDLDSPQWKDIEASCGGDGMLTAQLLRQVRDGDESAYLELFEQVCHQFTVGETAYVAVPHLARFARDSELNQRLEPLSIIGRVEAGRLAHRRSAPPLREQWQAEYFAAHEVALYLTAETLRTTDWEPLDSQQLLATLAALHGHTNLAMHLFLQPTDLSCPTCGEYIDFIEK